MIDKEKILLKFVDFRFFEFLLKDEPIIQMY